MEFTLEFETEAFRRWTEELIKQLDGEARRRVLKNVAFRFLRKVIKRTPVDKGRARAGWTSYMLANGVPTKVGDSDPEAVAEGEAASSFEEKFTGSDAFIILVNAVNYIVILEFGSSDQAAAGMMRITFRELRAEEVMTKEMRKELVEAIKRTNQKMPNRKVG